jgi:hypothetical protein
MRHFSWKPEGKKRKSLWEDIIKLDLTHVEFEVLTAVTIKGTVLCITGLASSGLLLDPEDGGDMFLRSIRCYKFEDCPLHGVHAGFELLTAFNYRTTGSTSLTIVNMITNFWATIRSCA